MSVYDEFEGWLDIDVSNLGLSDMFIEGVNYKLEDLLEIQ